MFAQRHRENVMRAAEEAIRAEQARAEQSGSSQPRRKFTKTSVKGSDYMSWVADPPWAPEDDPSSPFDQSPQEPDYNPFNYYSPNSNHEAHRHSSPEPQPESNLNAEHFSYGTFPDHAPQSTRQSDSSCEGFSAEREDATPQPEATPTPRASPGPSHYTRWQSEPTRSERDDQRRTALLESMRKIRELEKDKPLWEEAARKRRLLEEQEAREEEARKQAKAQAEAEAEFARFQEQARQRYNETERARIKQEHDRKDFITQQYFRKQSSFIPRPWSIRNAVSRYVDVSKEFDSANFQAMSLTFDNIPWPVEHDPRIVTFTDITWEAIESFFLAAELILGRSEYRSLVSKSQIRFHPDRWRSRGILAAVTNEIERDCLANAANTVSQALTPIWSNLKQRAEQ